MTARTPIDPATQELMARIERGDIVAIHKAGESANCPVCGARFGLKHSRQAGQKVCSHACSKVLTAAMTRVRAKMMEPARMSESQYKHDGKDPFLIVSSDGWASNADPVLGF